MFARSSWYFTSRASLFSAVRNRSRIRSPETFRRLLVRVVVLVVGLAALQGEFEARLGHPAEVVRLVDPHVLLVDALLVEVREEVAVDDVVGPLELVVLPCPEATRSPRVSMPPSVVCTSASSKFSSMNFTISGSSETR